MNKTSNSGKHDEFKSLAEEFKSKGVSLQFFKYDLELNEQPDIVIL